MLSVKGRELRKRNKGNVCETAFGACNRRETNCGSLRQLELKTERDLLFSYDLYKLE